MQNKSFNEPDSSLISVFRTNGSSKSKEQSMSPKVRFEESSVADTEVRPTVYTYREKN